MSESVVETNIPIPPARNERLSGIQLGDLDVGHSKIVPKARRGSLSTAIRVQKYLNPGQNFTTRVIDKDTIRVWRTA